jgi:hypothetical protein
MRAPLLWGVVWGGIQAASPFGFWWLDSATVYALGLALIASVYIGFSVADRRWKFIAVECSVAAVFVLVAAVVRVCSAVGGSSPAIHNGRRPNNRPHSTSKDFEVQCLYGLQSPR